MARSRLLAGLLSLVFILTGSVSCGASRPATTQAPAITQETPIPEAPATAGKVSIGSDLGTILIRPEPGKYLIYDKQKMEGVVLGDVSVESVVYDGTNFPGIYPANEYFGLQKGDTLRRFTVQVRNRLDYGGWMSLDIIQGDAFGITGTGAFRQFKRAPFSQYIAEKSEGQFVLYLKPKQYEVAYELKASDILDTYDNIPVSNTYIFIPVAGGKGDYPAILFQEGITFKDITVTSVVYDSTNTRFLYYEDSSTRSMVETKDGDIILKVSGRIENDRNQSGWFGFHANGYDINGQEVSYCLENGYLMGHIAYYSKAKGTDEFEVYLTFDESVATVELGFGGLMKDMPP
jgi:hypothetical protein